MSQSGFEDAYLQKQLTEKGTSHQPVKMADGVYHIQSLGNAGFVRTPEGIVCVDTGNPLDPESYLASLRSITQERICLIIYTHGHVDHAANALSIINEAERRGDPRPVILAQSLVEKRLDRYAQTRDLQNTINHIQFQLPDSHAGWPNDECFVRPDQTYEERHSFKMGGLTFELTHERGETDDATWIWLPEREAIFSGDLFISSCPNAGNPLKIQRYVQEWADALIRMSKKEAVVLGPGHGQVVRGKEMIQEMLLTTADALKYLYNEVIYRLNAGQWLDQIRAEVRLPDTLARHPALASIYGSPDFIVCSVYHQHRGWWDGNPSNLFASRSWEIADEVIGLTGAFNLFARAEQLVRENQLQQALHLFDFLIQSSRVNQEERERAAHVKRQVCAMLAVNEPSYIARNILLS